MPINPMALPFFPRVLAGGLLALAVGGCVVAPTPYATGPVVAVEPPAPHVEVYGPPPVVGQVWISGYWGWRDSRHVWVPGYWDAPRPGYRWVPHRWERGGGGWRERGGYWGR